MGVKSENQSNSPEPNSLTLKMKAAHFSEHQEKTYYPIWCNNAKDQHLTSTCFQSLRTYNMNLN